MKYLLFLSILLTGAVGALCQENYPTVRTAEEAYARHEYQRAAHLYEKIVTFHHVPANAQDRLAECYREQNDFGKAAKIYDQITTQHPENAQAWVYYGDILKSMGRYPEAKAAYRQAPDSLRVRIADRIAGCDSALAWMAAPVPYKVTNLSAVNTANSDWGAQWYAPHSIVFTSDSLRTRILGKARREARKLYRRTGHPFQKIYMIDSTDKGMGPVRGFSEEMNANAYHDGPVSFSSKGDTAYFTVTNPETLNGPGDTVSYKEGKRTITWGLRRLEIFWAVRDSNGTWGPPHSLSADNTGRYSVGHATLSGDGQVLYFTGDMPGGYGKTDIWYVERQGDGSWSAPVNCGPILNTEEAEAFPNVGVDGRLYFASKGHVGMGGYDVFRATGAKAAWQSVRNLGYPLNSPGDDFYFTTKDSLSGFLSSNRPGGMGGDDIYQYAFITGTPGTPVTYVPHTVPGAGDLSGTIERPIAALGSPADTRKTGVAGNNPGADNHAGTGNGSAAANRPGTGSVSGNGSGANNRAGADNRNGSGSGADSRAAVTIAASNVAGANPGTPPGTSPSTPPGTPPRRTNTVDSLSGESTQGAPHTDSAVKTGYTGGYAGGGVNTTAGQDTLSVRLSLQRSPRFGEIFVLRNLYYNFNKSDIRPDASTVLDGLIGYLNQFPGVTIDLSSHTDSRGSDAYNLALSLKRAQAARKYLLDHGIAPGRVQIHGYGETRLVNGCSNGVPCSSAQHQANRRTEVRVLHP